MKKPKNKHGKILKKTYRKPELETQALNYITNSACAQCTTVPVGQSFSVGGCVSDNSGDVGGS